MKQPIYISPGEVLTSKKERIFNSGAVGSCIIVTAYDKQLEVGGMAHILLPGHSPEPLSENSLKYTANALDELNKQLTKLDSSLSQAVICIVGGGNVLKELNDKICRANIASIREELKKRNLEAEYVSLGGHLRRVVELHLPGGKVFTSEGDGALMLRWEKGFY